MNQDVELNLYQKKIIEYAKISHNEFSLHCIKVNATYEKGYNIKNISAME